MLSPKDEPQQEMQDIHRSDVLQIRIDDQNALFCDEQPVTLAELQQQVESFLASRQTENYVLDVVTARQSSYDAYFNMQNAIGCLFQYAECHCGSLQEAEQASDQNQGGREG